MPSGRRIIWSICARGVPLALAEFRRVLRPQGFALVTMPDLQQVAALIAEGNQEGTAYLSAMGPIAPLDMRDGFRPAVAAGNDFMGHRTGFTIEILSAHLQAAGFVQVQVRRTGPLPCGRRWSTPGKVRRTGLVAMARALRAFSSVWPLGGIVADL